VLGTAASGFVPRIGEIAMDWRVIGFSIAASLASGLIFGLAPALRLSKARATDALKDGGRGASRAGVSRSRGVLVMTECALALILLTGAGLLLRSLAHLDAVDPGFDTSNVLAVRLEFPPEPPPTAAERTQTSPIAQARARARVGLAGQLVERLRGLQGVTQVGFIDDLMVNGRGNRSVTIPGRSAEASGSGELNEALMSAGFFPVMQVPLRRGRLIADEDVEQKIRALWSPVRTDLSLAEKERLAVPEPVVVNEAFAKRFFPGEDAVGRKFCIDPTNKTYWYEIVGVVGDMHRQGLDRRPIPEYYGPWILSPNGRADLLLRTSGDPLALASSVREVARSVIPGVTVVSASTADALLGDFSAQRRLQTWLLSVFALLALTLAAIGIFGLVHFAVAERTREIGVRVALGATPGQVMSLVLGEGMRTPVVGIVVGLAASLALTRVLSSLLFGVGATDPVTFAAMAAVLAAVASIACWLAGRRALGVDPVRALRD
jgi:predicted permease